MQCTFLLILNNVWSCRCSKIKLNFNRKQWPEFGEKDKIKNKILDLPKGKWTMIYFFNNMLTKLAISYRDQLTITIFKNNKIKWNFFNYYFLLQRLTNWIGINPLGSNSIQIKFEKWVAFFWLVWVGNDLLPVEEIQKDKTETQNETD